MNEVVEKEIINIEDIIYEINGKQVMLDSDLAMLYQIETKRINEAVSRNKEKFPERFAFRISENEYRILKSQIATSKGGARKGHMVFTEQGVAMLSTILKSKVAIQTSIRIMDAFVAMRRYISSNLIEQKFINNLVLEDHDKIKLLQESFKKFEEKKKVNEIYYKGQIYDAYSKIKDIFCLAKKELVIIDSYADKTVLDMIKSIKAKVLLITKENNKLTELDIEKYNKQYSNLKVIRNKNFHDRYFIIDKEEVYHCGTSINYAGSKIFSINTLEDNIIKESIIEVIEKIGKKVQ